MKHSIKILLFRLLGRGRNATVRVFVLGVVTVMIFLLPFLAIACGFRFSSPWAISLSVSVITTVLLVIKRSLDGFVKIDKRTGASSLDQAWADLDQAHRIKLVARRRQALLDKAHPKETKDGQPRSL